MSGIEMAKVYRLNHYFWIVLMVVFLLQSWVKAQPIPLPTTVPEIVILHEENFDDPETDEWRANWGTWEIVEVEDNDHVNGVLRTTGSGEYVLPESLRWDDYVLELRFMVRDWGEDINSAVMFKVRSTPGTGCPSLELQLDRFERRMRVSGAPPTCFTERGLGQVFGFVDRTIWYTVRMEVEGNHYRVYVDDDLLFRGTQSDRKSGSVGIVSWMVGEVWYDDIRVWEVAKHNE